MTASTDGRDQAQAPPKYVPVDRAPSFFAPVEVERLVPADHRVRAIWELLGKLDFSRWEEGIESREGAAGRPCFPPRLLASIWLYGYSIEIASARALARMMGWEPGLRWLTGCQEINAHTLSDFRVQDQERLDELFTNLVTVLRREGLVDLKVVTQDGTKVEAQAGRHSLHGGKRSKGSWPKHGSISRSWIGRRGKRRCKTSAKRLPRSGRGGSGWSGWNGRWKKFRSGEARLPPAGANRCG